MMNEPELNEVMNNLINSFINDIEDNTRMMGSPRKVNLTFPGIRYLKEAMQLCYNKGLNDAKRKGVK